jgi:probable F420-dependent oxidoreductase
MRPFRFGYQVKVDDPVELHRQAQAAEEAGFDVLCTFDHLGASFSALAPLVSAAGCTRHIRLCPLVLNNDFHHPALLAQELATLDRLSGGRLEVGIGAGHSFTEYAAAGMSFDAPKVRKARMAEAVEILRRLLDGVTVTHAGEHYRLDGVTILTPQQSHVPILIGVNGRAALAHAARHGDTIGLTMLGRTLADGHSHEVRWAPERLDRTVAWIRACAGDRAPALELNALVQALIVTDDRVGAADALSAEVDGLSAADALVTPFIAVGSTDEIADHLLQCRARWGISYYVVRDIDPFVGVMERIRRVDAEH